MFSKKKQIPFGAMLTFLMRSGLAFVQESEKGAPSFGFEQETFLSDLEGVPFLLRSNFSEAERLASFVQLQVP